MKNQMGFTHWVIVILISIMAVGLVGVAWYYEENKEKTTTTNINTVVNQNVNTNSITNTAVININSTINTNAVTDITNDWLTYINSEYKFSIEYPKLYKANEDRNASVLFSYLFEYPIDVTRGVYITISEKTTEGLISMLWVENGYKNIGGEIWQAFTYNPENDPGAGSQSKGVRYLIERGEKTYIIYAPVEVSWRTYTSYSGKEIMGMSAEEVDANVERMLSTFVFTD